MILVHVSIGFSDNCLSYSLKLVVDKSRVNPHNSLCASQPSPAPKIPML